MSRSIQDLLVVSDIDGTLLTDALELPACNLENIRLFTSLGGHFTVATGRTVESVTRYPQMMDMLSPIIACGGSVIYNFAKNEAEVCHTLPRMIARKAVLDVMQAVPGINVVATGDDLRNYQVAGGPFAQRLYDDENLRVFVRPPSDLPPNWTKVLFAGSPELIEQAADFVVGRPYPGAYFVTSSKVYMEMLPEGITKGSALHELCDLLGLKIENTSVLGDYLNDLEIMREAGHSVAMKNAPPEVRMTASEVGGSNNEGGVGQYLYRLIKEYA